MLAYIDFEDGNKAFDKNYKALSGAYFARSVVSLGISILAGVASISSTGPLLRLIFGQNSNLKIISAIEGLAGSRYAPMILRLIGIGSLVTVGISVAMIYLYPDDMEEWCWHSCLKKWKSDALLKPFKDQETELQKLYEALEALT
ncbi:hypothetical protein [Pseudomonas sp. Marseille-P9899]|uniref:hypothetical protein n=1 Tax=Pseudomonas sp. Marseille-P9899 TaxID=2730401 RepID=UPI00158C5202|nr:hypothetical protein [Pseudomonas sp. Marseille-P9899]